MNFKESIIHIKSSLYILTCLMFLCLGDLNVLKGNLITSKMFFCFSIFYGFVVIVRSIKRIKEIKNKN